ncbi:TatD family hydrolase [Vulgatibacter incomptus]|uniref:Putative deoxyribonuclease YcfH n=1 Tax=Vulgatibacter incomptus TaxID=1391653 RepID=A0A0K1PAC3_9BACT|nr:TatD family hydrolase [Vulgatibacter incomptus]AKU90452.1 Putative deoxyribonuclease YcfH [Vulgatibacter incomptus]
MDLIDSHAHVDSEKYDGDRDEVIARARQSGVSRIVAVGQWQGPGDFGGAHALAKAHPGYFFATIGIHPHEVANVPEEDWLELERLAALPETIAIGETGLDYFYEHSPREEQRKWFRHQLELASRLGKPVVIHTRDADDDTFEILRDMTPKAGVIHCFTGGPERARAYLDLGLYLSVPGVVTFKNAEPLREAVRAAPLDRLLIETDCPYLAPIPHRGKRNEPAFVRIVAETIAELKGLPVEEVAAATTSNAMELFRLG